MSTALAVRERQPLLLVLPIGPGDHMPCKHRQPTGCPISWEKHSKNGAKSYIHPLMTALLGKLLWCLCFLFDFHHPTDDPVTDAAPGSFVCGFGFFFPQLP